MSPEVMQWLLGGGGIALLGGGIKVWWTDYKAVQKEKRDAVAAEKRSLEERAERLQAKLDSVLADAMAKALDDKRERAELIAILNKFQELTVIMTEVTKARARDQ